MESLKSLMIHDYFHLYSSYVGFHDTMSKVVSKIEEMSKYGYCTIIRFIYLSDYRASDREMEIYAKELQDIAGKVKHDNMNYLEKKSSLSNDLRSLIKRVDKSAD
jgi:hypothetical protein